MGQFEPSPQPRARRTRVIRLILLVGLLLCTAAVAAWRYWPRSTRVPPDEDPRVSYPSIYRNVRPGVAYVGDAVCVQCHEPWADSYHQHPMSRSVLSTMDPRAPAGVVARFDKPGFRYEVIRRDGKMYHRESATNTSGKPVVALEAEVPYVVGSGTRGRTYLVNHDGYLFQSPISWYARRDTWDLSPGYEHGNLHFTRPINADCLFCHANHTEPVPHTVNQFRQPLFEGLPIGCERCHGPGSLHVQRRQTGEDITGVDDTIVNPQRLEPVLREAVCQQCHLHADVNVLRRGRLWNEFRPGLPLDRFAAYFVRGDAARDPRKAVGQVEQMYASQCFLKSSGANQLGCISCHDPHDYPAPAKKVSYYRQRCLECHQTRPCTAPIHDRQARQDNCVACHMPRFNSSNIVHTAITDHRILRRPETELAATPGAPREPPLVRFPPQSATGSDPDAARDLGVALVKWSRTKADRERPMKLADPLLAAAVQRRPDDIAAWEAWGSALWALNRPNEALAAFQQGLEHAPADESLLYYAALLCGSAELRDQAIGYWQRAIAVNPWARDYHERLARLEADAGRYADAAKHCRAALRLDPASWDNRQLLIQCELRLGEEDQARKDFDTLLAFQPPDSEALRRWFREQPRAHP